MSMKFMTRIGVYDVYDVYDVMVQNRYEFRCVYCTPSYNRNNRLRQTTYRAVQRSPRIPTSGKEAAVGLVDAPNITKTPPNSASMNTYYSLPQKSRI